MAVGSERLPRIPVGGQAEARPGERAQGQGLSLEQSLRDLLSNAVRTDDSLRDELAQLRATTPAAGRSLDVAALIREDRDGR